MTTNDHSTHKDKVADISGAVGKLSVAYNGEQGGERGSKIAMLSVDNLEDILQYTTHSFVQSCRLVCSDWNAFIARYPKCFHQRRQSRSLDIVPDWVINYHPFRFPNEEAKEGAERTKNWLDIEAFKDYCKGDLQPLADSMAGTLFDPTARNEQLFAVLLELNNHTPLINLRIPNVLTAETAFHFVHFLKHLHGCAIDVIDLEPGTRVPFFTHLPSPVRCCCLRIEYIDHWEAFNRTFEFFRTNDVSSIVPEVMIDIYGDWNAWPMDPLDPTEAIASEDYEKSGAVFHEFTFFYRNEQTGKLFEVRADVRTITVRRVRTTTVYKVVLTLNGGGD